MPDGLDPDDVATQGQEAYQKCLDAAMPLIDYRLHALHRKYDLTSTTQKRKYIEEALKIVKTADSESVKEELLKRLRDITGVSYSALERDLQSVKESEPETESGETGFPKDRITETAAGTDKESKAKRFILAAKLFSAPYAKSFSVLDLPFTDETHILIARYIQEHESVGEKLRPSELFELLDENSAEFNAILDLNYGETLIGETAERFFKDSVKTLQLEALEQEISECTRQFSAETEVDIRRAISKRLGDLVKKRDELRRRK
jgi:DNA primase